jgi:hypothetical protein
LNASSIQLSPRHLFFRASAALAGASLLTLAALAIGMPPPPAGAPPATVAAATRTPDSPQALRFAHAVQALRAQDYAGAYGRFADLADEGHAASAQWALAMVSQGPTIFGSEWSATRGQLRRWSAISARETRDHAELIAEHDRGE